MKAPLSERELGTLSFAGLTLDLGRGCLLDATGALELRPKSFDVLRHLALKAGELVTKDELLQAVWPNVTVVEESLSRCISDIRRCLGPDRARLIKTVAKRGYLLDVSVDRASLRPAPTEQPDLPGGPSIVVLPFQNLSGDPQQEYFADGLVDDIIAALVRYKSLFVIARSSSFTYKGQAVDAVEIGQELGVRYALSGSVRKSGERLRISGQLIDTSSGAHLWAGTFDGQLDQIFDLQDEVSSRVAGVIDPVLSEAEIRRASRRPTADLTAYDLYLHAVPLVHAWSNETATRAIERLEQAVARDPSYGRALAALAFCHSQKVWSGWSADPTSEATRGRELARQALAIGPDDPDTVGTAAGALMNFGDDIHFLKGLIDDAVARNPSSAFSWFWSGWMRTFACEPNVAIAHLERSLRLDPRAPRRAFHLTPIGICHFFERRFEQAAPQLEASFLELPSYPTTIWFLAACYVQMGRLGEARALAERTGVLASENWRSSVRLFRNPEYRDYLVGSLQRLTAR